MKKQYAVLFGFLIFAILILLNSAIFPNFLTSGIQAVFSLPKSALYNLKTSFSGDDSEVVKQLKQENARLTKIVTDYERLKGDNEALKSQFETGSTLTYKQIPARVIGFSGKFSAPSVLIIDQGKSVGVETGQAVIIGDNLVGKIGNVSDNYSKVLLTTAPDFSTLAAGSENSSLGVVTGVEDFILFDRVSINDTLTNGETVVTKGEVNDAGIGIPPDLVVGKIQAVARDASQPFQNAKVASNVPFSRIEKVFIILGPNE